MPPRGAELAAGRARVKYPVKGFSVTVLGLGGGIARSPCRPVKTGFHPIWHARPAIGTGVAATAAQAQETHKGIREWIAANVDRATAEAIRIQYGGSANAGNAPELSSFPDIDGFLVGGASLKPEFAEIVAAISKEKGWTPPPSGDPFPPEVYERAGLKKTGFISWAVA